MAIEKYEHVATAARSASVMRGSPILARSGSFCCGAAFPRESRARRRARRRSFAERLSCRPGFPRASRRAEVRIERLQLLAAAAHVGRMW